MILGKVVQRVVLLRILMELKPSALSVPRVSFRRTPCTGTWGVILRENVGGGSILRPLPTLLLAPLCRRKLMAWAIRPWHRLWFHLIPVPLSLLCTSTFVPICKIDEYWGTFDHILIYLVLKSIFKSKNNFSKFKKNIHFFKIYKNNTVSQVVFLIFKNNNKKTYLNKSILKITFLFWFYKKHSKFNLCNIN